MPDLLLGQVFLTKGLEHSKRLLVLVIFSGELLFSDCSAHAFVQFDFGFLYKVLLALTVGFLKTMSCYMFG